MSMIKVSEYIAKTLKEQGVNHVFMISGGGAMHLNDSFANHIPYICNHHEQASAIAAEGYARLHQKLVAVNVTTGPGGVNALNGVFGQWVDSAPVIYISGQVKFETTLASQNDQNLRQLGDQEVDIISMVKPITKYAVMVTNPNDIGKILAKAIYLAKSGRPGPVWIDVPMNVQGAMIDEDNLEKYQIEKTDFNSDLSVKINQAIDLLKNAKRPLIVAGHGIRISQTTEIFKSIINELNIPVLTSFNAFDLIPSDHNLFIGRFGTIGQRAGNFALQNADVVLFLGTRNNIRQASYNWENYAARAQKIIVDIDVAELNKPTVKADLAIHADLKDFFAVFKNEISGLDFTNKASWLEWCQIRKEKYSPVSNPEYKKSLGLINPYDFILSLTSKMKNGDVAVTGNGTACVAFFQAGIVKKDQRIFWNSGNASMGYDLPAAIGACFANDKKDVICITGDGSIMMNLQELQTVKHYNLPLKIFVLNNNGYSSIRQTQKNFFTGKLVASSTETGVSTPDFLELAKAFQIPAIRLSKPENLANEIERILKTKGPILCEIMLDPEYIFQPKLSSEKLPDGRMISKPLEDMYPFLPRDEFNQNIIND